MAIQTLLNQSEIIKFTSLQDTFPKCDLQNIRKVEIKEFRDCLGIDFYREIKGDLAKYDSCGVWENGRQYKLGEIVIHNGVYYQAIQLSTEHPSNSGYWRSLPKFQTDCYNELWCDGFLAEFLSWSVVKNVFPYTIAQMSASGLVQNFGQYSKVADQKTVNCIQVAIDRDIQLSFENLDFWIRDNNEGCFDLYKGLDISACCDCGCKKENCVCQTNCVTIKSRKNKYRAA